MSEKLPFELLALRPRRKRPRAASARRMCAITPDVAYTGTARPIALPIPSASAARSPEAGFDIDVGRASRAGPRPRLGASLVTLPARWRRAVYA